MGIASFLALMACDQASVGAKQNEQTIQPEEQQTPETQVMAALMDYISVSEADSAAAIVLKSTSVVPLYDAYYDRLVYAVLSDQNELMTFVDNEISEGANGYSFIYVKQWVSESGIEFSDIEMHYPYAESEAGKGSLHYTLGTENYNFTIEFVNYSPQLILAQSKMNHTLEQRWTDLANEVKQQQKLLSATPNGYEHCVDSIPNSSATDVIEISRCLKVTANYLNQLK
jgi:hypothetical protein